MKPFGVVTRYREHLGRFDLSFWESKDVGGAKSEAPAGSVPMVSCFGDNRLAKAHPDWVQLGPQGEVGDRSTRYFDWSTLCPTRPEVFDLALRWVEDALSEQGLRLDDVNYARQDYCQCLACRQAIAKSGLDFFSYRQQRILSFVQRVREKTKAPLYLTLYPDPYPGHLQKRFGVDPGRLGDIVDTFVVPIYDLGYTTTYWLEVLAMGFRDLLKRPFLIELYGLDLPEEKLLKAAEVANTYADGVLIAYDRDLPKLERLRDALRAGKLKQDL